MLDFFNIEKYKENNRLEAKAAAVGLPKSLWATYSAFANTNGVLGVDYGTYPQVRTFVFGLKANF